MQHFQIGQKVTYARTGERGIVKSLSDNPNFVFVVYHCGGDWANYQNYTSSPTKCADLVEGWPRYNFSVDLFDASFYSQQKRQWAPRGFDFDSRQHNRFQKWTRISHEDPVQAEELRLFYESEGYETTKE
jgi:hypothetical protein